VCPVAILAFARYCSYFRNSIRSDRRLGQRPDARGILGE
jgi:hypothetical protein